MPSTNASIIETSKRFWDSSTPAAIVIPSEMAFPKGSKPPTTQKNYRKSSIAAATIMTVVTLSAIIFLVMWYVRRARRERRQREKEELSRNALGPSTFTLTEDTAQVLDDFLMIEEEQQSERASIMFSRSRSPSLSFVVDETDRRSSMTRLYRTSLDASATGLSKNETSSTHMSTEGTARPSTSTPDRYTHSSQNLSVQQQPSSPVSRLSQSSAVPPTERSSQLWSTTTGTAEDMTPTALSREPGSSRTSHSTEQRTRPSASVRSSQALSRGSEASMGPGSPWSLRSVAWMFEEPENSHRVHGEGSRGGGSGESARDTRSANDSSSRPSSGQSSRRSTVVYPASPLSQSFGS
ncbi:hypothetical protein N7474_008014 [Penicillium riverlandense]|uniref:uncharacterized protein n=1 Tax=Penicillium riverlandense TaxID=1903569 RepID=UPI0025477791|nr:uncharacterized protein N7474_008014 [Penicillium riverlandense]KAJ5811713.1 hypothetical protein N7474_008014 [Penicillium riverlandense]